MKDISLLKSKVKEYLKGITQDNFHQSYDGLIEILEQFRGLMSKEELRMVLKEIDNEIEMDQYQEDVFLEVSSRLEGFSSDRDRIEWS